MIRDITGQRFGRFTALYPTEKRIARNVVWVVQCDCGTVKEISNKDLHGIKSCGCSHFTNPYRSHRLYAIWRNMIRRCHNPADDAYPRYGGRGILVCEEWHDMGRFVADMYPTYKTGLTIERKDNDKGYSPDNCVWASIQDQANNRRSSRYITYKGETKTVAEWARSLGLRYQTVLARLQDGWAEDEALSVPIMSDWQLSDKKNSKRQR